MIMGKGWQEIINQLSQEGLQTMYQPEFRLDAYKQALNSAEYLLYTGGEDALAQSIIDAKQAGIKVIAPPQEDLTVDYPFVTQEDLNKIFHDMEINEVEDWTWKRYAQGHLKIWQKLIDKRAKRK